jgi:ribulose-phosphate 3-epimerase
VQRVFNTLKMEAHLMVADPLPIAHDLIRNDFARILAHYESFNNDDDLRNALLLWQGGGVEVGLAIAASTSVEKVRTFEPLCDFFNVMTIDTIGSQGGAFDGSLIERIRQLHEWYPSKTIVADGGMNKDTLALAVQAGASRVVVGSAIMRAQDMAASYKQLQSIANSAV